MSKIVSKVAKNADSYQQNYAYHSALQAELRERIAAAATGSRDHLIERHRQRGVDGPAAADCDGLRYGARDRGGFARHASLRGNRHARERDAARLCDTAGEWQRG